MAKKENVKVHCPCPLCQGALVDPVKKMQHTGQARSSMAQQPERMWYMGYWWRKEDEL